MRRPLPEPRETLRLQRAFLDDLIGRAPRSEAEREAVFRRPPRGTVADRWHVYAHGYLARLTEALGLEFAAVARILGREAFAALIARYIAVFPPRSFDLADAGDRLSRFLEFDVLSSELPFLPDLARLERAASVCFTAADPRPVAWEDLRGRAPEEVAALRLGLAPGVTLIASDWPVSELWACRLEENDDAVSIPLDGPPERLLVYRNGVGVRVAALSPPEASLVAAAGAGDLTLEELQELSGTAADASSVGAMLDAFRSLVERGIFVHKRSTGWTGALEIPKEDS